MHPDRDKPIKLILTRAEFQKDASIVSEVDKEGQRKHIYQFSVALTIESSL